MFSIFQLVSTFVKLCLFLSKCVKFSQNVKSSCRSQQTMQPNNRRWLWPAGVKRGSTGEWGARAEEHRRQPDRNIICWDCCASAVPHENPILFCDQRPLEKLGTRNMGWSTFPLHGMSLWVNTPLTCPNAPNSHLALLLTHNKAIFSIVFN